MPLVLLVQILPCQDLQDPLGLKELLVSTDKTVLQALQGPKALLVTTASTVKTESQGLQERRGSQELRGLLVLQELKDLQAQILLFLDLLVLRGLQGHKGLAVRLQTRATLGQLDLQVLLWLVCHISTILAVTFQTMGRLFLLLLGWQWLDTLTRGPTQTSLG